MDIVTSVSTFFYAITVVTLLFGVGELYDQFRGE